VRAGGAARPGAGWPGDPADASTPVATSASEVRSIAATASLSDLDAAVSVCRACPRLVEWRERVAVEKRAAYAGEDYWGRPAPSFGDPAASVLIVGLAPAAHGANRTGRMFTGDRSGDWLFAALHRAGYASQASSTHAGDGLVLTGVRITAACHCAPPANQPTPEERATCAGWLDREFALLTTPGETEGSAAGGLEGAAAGPGSRGQLSSILCLGSIAWDAVLGAARRLGWGVGVPKPRFGHGSEALLDAAGHPVRLVGSYHVSQQNTFTGRLTTDMLDEVIARL
jgi:uracil-DNA glycosylase